MTEKNVVKFQKHIILLWKKKTKSIAKSKLVINLLCPSRCFFNAATFSNTVKCLVEYPFDSSALLPLYDLVKQFDKESVCLCMNSSCLPGQTVKLGHITATKPTSRLNKLTWLAKTFQQNGFSTLSCQTNQQVKWILN